MLLSIYFILPPSSFQWPAARFYIPFFVAYNPIALRDSPRSLSEESLDPLSPERQEAVMSKRKTLSLAVVLALGLAVCAPQVALGNRVLYEPAPSADATQPSTQPADADAADD